MPETENEKIARLEEELKHLRAENKRLRDNWNIIGHKIRDADMVFKKMSEFLSALSTVAWYKEDENV